MFFIHSSSFWYNFEKGKLVHPMNYSNELSITIYDISKASFLVSYGSTPFKASVNILVNSNRHLRAPKSLKIDHFVYQA